MDLKSKMRKECMTMIRRKPIEKRKEQERQIQDRLTNNQFWKKATTIGLTISMDHEIDTEPLIEQAILENKSIAIPYCHGKVMNFYHFTTYADLKRSRFGVLEPDPALASYVRPDQIDLQIVPGLVFSYDGYRIGHGAGYYDRYLQSYNNMTVSLLFDEQLYENIPVEEHDIPVQKLITPKREYCI